MSHGNSSTGGTVTLDFFVVERLITIVFERSTLTMATSRSKSTTTKDDNNAAQFLRRLFAGVLGLLLIREERRPMVGSLNRALISFLVAFFSHGLSLPTR